MPGQGQVAGDCARPSALGCAPGRPNCLVHARQ